MTSYLGDARNRLQSALDAIDAVPNQAEFPGIGNVRAELAKMLSSIDDQSLPERRFRHAGLGRIATDSWPLGAEATTAVIEAEQAYLWLP